MHVTEIMTYDWPLLIVHSSSIARRCMFVNSLVAMANSSSTAFQPYTISRFQPLGLLEPNKSNWVRLKVVKKADE